MAFAVRPHRCALYDGSKYVVEKYNTVTITPASIPHLAEIPDTSNLSAAAMGISRKYEDGLPALPAVAAELDEVVQNSQEQKCSRPIARNHSAQRRVH